MSTGPELEMESTGEQETLGAAMDDIENFATNALGFVREVYEWPEAHRMLVEAGLHGAKVRRHHSVATYSIATFVHKIKTYICAA